MPKLITSEEFGGAKQDDGSMCREASRVGERFGPKIKAEGLDMFGRDLCRRWWASGKQGREVSAARIFLCADICEEFGKAGLRSRAPGPLWW